MRGRREGRGIEAPESQLFPECSSSACSECVDTATGPLQTMSRPRSASWPDGNVVYPTCEARSRGENDLTQDDSAAKAEFQRIRGSSERIPASERPIYCVVNMTRHIVTSGIHHDKCMMLLLGIRATRSIIILPQHHSGAPELMG